MTTPTPGASAPVVFTFQTSEVRTVDREGEPWFVLADVADILGFSRSRDAARVLDEDEKGAHIVRPLGGEQEVTIISESGIYALALKSRRPEAREFRKWVTSDVLPAIRKTGRYDALQAHLSAPVPTFANRRWLIVVAPDGRETAKPIDPEEFLCKLAELPGLIRDPGFMIDGTELLEIVHACADRMASKLAGGTTRKRLP